MTPSVRPSPRTSISRRRRRSLLSAVVLATWLLAAGSVGRAAYTDGHASADVQGADAQPARQHVKPADRGGSDAADGRTWGTAKASIQAAITSGGPGVEVWVAEGTYTAPVQLTDGAAVYGGFAGTETALEQRDLEAHASVLESARVTVPTSVLSAATLDGFTLSYGRGIDVAGAAVLRNNTIERQWLNTSAATGAVVVQKTGTATIAGNIISDNGVSGVYALGQATLARNTITGNADTGIVVGSGAQAEITDNLVRRNGLGGEPGGGISVAGTATITGNVIAFNAASQSSFSAGGVYVQGTATIANNVIAGNSAWRGGALTLRGGSTTLVNNTITGNRAMNGGAVFALSAPKALLASNILAFNESGFYMSGSGTVTFRNNDVFGNTRYNYQGVADPTGTDGNIAQDPMLDDIYTSVHLQGGSPAIDAGSDADAVGSTDVDGEARIQGAHVDIGADEWHGPAIPVRPPRILHVSPAGDDAATGLTWQDAKRTVAAALAAARPEDEIWVAAGTYTENLRVNTPAVAIYGGFSGTEALREQRDATTNTTTLDGGATPYGVRAELGGLVLDGFTLVNGRGAHILVNGSATITRNRLEGHAPSPPAGDAAIDVWGEAEVRNNHITGAGTGVRVNGWAVIANNEIVASGTGIDIGYQYNAQAINNLIRDGQIALKINGSLTANSNTITGSDDPNGAVYVYRSASLANNIIAFNAAGVSHPYDQGAITFRNNDVFGNAAYDYKINAEDPTGASGNISQDPLFVDRASGNFRLLPASPAVNAGVNSAVFPWQTDLDGRSRVIGGTVDIGAYEYDPAAPPPFTLADARRALAIWAGITQATSDDMTRLNLDGPDVPSIRLPDAIRAARRAVGLEGG